MSGGGLPADVAAFLRELQPELMFLLDDLSAITEESLDARCLSAVANLCLRFLQFVRATSPDDAVAMILRWEELLIRLLAHPRKQEALRALFSWFAAGVPRGHYALQTIMARIHDPETRKTMNSELDELLEEGSLRGQRHLVRSMIVARFGSLPADLAPVIAGGSLADLEKWSIRILTAGSPAAVFES